MIGTYAKNVSFPEAFRSTSVWGYPEGMSIVDTVPEEYRDLIHPHWLKYPPVNPMWHYLLGIIFLLLGILSTCGNCIVLYIFMTKKSLRTPANMFVINLAFADLMMMVSQYPMYIYCCFIGGYWPLGAHGCEFHAFSAAITGDTALLTLVAIGYDRYCVIVKAFDGGHMTSLKAFFIIIFCWTYATCLTIWPLFGWNRFIPEGILTSCSFDYLSQDWHHRSFGLMVFSCCFCIPFTAITFFYSQIVLAIRRHEKALRAQAKKMNVESLRSNADMSKQSQEVRVAKVAVANVGLWLITWVPYAYVVMTGMFGNTETLTPLVSGLPGLILKTASCYNPVMFAISHPKFRLALQESMPWFCIHEPKGDDVASSKTESEAK
uniref:Opsin M1 n=1 Tax=Neogonodactylus oerstedii TaxID=85128 RepID=A0A6H0X1L9_NEOOE|nr:opsin M1 [Neogonodactylus oerstedii]